MKKIILLTTLIFAGCAGQRIETSIEREEFYAFATESFIRYGENRLDKLEDNQITKAMSLCHQGKEKEGLNELKNQFKTRRKSALYWMHIGNCYYLQENHPKAEFFFQMALEHAKEKGLNTAVINNNLGVIYLGKRHYATSVNYFRKAIKDGPTFMTPKYNLAQIHLQFGRASKAINLLQKIYANNQNDVDVLAAMATSFLYMKNYHKALTFFEKMPKKFLTREDITLHYAMTLYHLGRYEEALNAIGNQETPKYVEIKHSTRRLAVLIRDKMKEIEETEVRKHKTSPERKKSNSVSSL